MSKAISEMSLSELVEAYNAKSGKDPIKKFKDRATGIKRLSELSATGPLTGRPIAEIASADKPAAKKAKPAKKQEEKKNVSANKLAAQFEARVGSNRELLLMALDANYKKQVPLNALLKAVYGSQNIENKGALEMVIKGARTTIENNKLPFDLKKEKNEAKEISYGIYPK